MILKPKYFLLNYSTAAALRSATPSAAAATPRGGAAARQAGPAGPARGAAENADVAGRTEDHHQAAGPR